MPYEELTIQPSVQPETFRPTEPVHAEIVTVALFIGALVASILLRPKQRNNGQRNFEDQISTTATRGTPIPYILGRRRVGVVVGWVGNRQTVTVGGGGGKGTGGGGGGQLEFYEQAWHIICVGPCSKIWGIYANGRLIKDEFDAATYPSGSTLTTLDGQDAFRIYWGENDQDVDDDLAFATETSSRWPNTCYLYWVTKRLGSSPNWPQIEIDIERLCQDNDVFSGSTYEENNGVNPGHAIAQMWAAPFPQGLGYPASELDAISLNDVADLAATEDHGVNIVAEGGEAKDIFTSIAFDFSMVLTQHQNTLWFKPVRAEGGTIPVLDTVTVPPKLEIESLPNSRRNNRLKFTFPSADHNFRQYDIKIDNDADAEYSFDEGSIELNSITSYSVANPIVNRKALEEFARTNAISFQAGFASRLLLPGMVAYLTDIGTVRISEIDFGEFASNAVSIKATQDAFSSAVISDSQDLYLPLNDYRDVEADTFTWVENPGGGIIVFRIRAHDQIIGSEVHVSADGTTYRDEGNQNVPSFGGLLETEVLGPSAGITPGNVTSSASFEPVTDDFDLVQQLQENSSEWMNGAQIALLYHDDGAGTIYKELVYVRAVNVNSESAWADATAKVIGNAVVPSGGSQGLRYIATTNGTTGATEPTWPRTLGDTVNDNGVVWEAHNPSYSAVDIIRGRRNSDVAAFPLTGNGSYIYIMDPNYIEVIQSPLLEEGASICIKTQPRTLTQELDLSLATAECNTYNGPLSEVALLTGDDEVLLAGDGQPLIAYT